MAGRCDVAARLAEGRPAVEHTQTYVQACHELGYQHPDLTAHASQVHGWYDTEAGLDLRILDDDSAELHAAANTLDEALWLQRMQVAEIAAAWTGLGADSATAFLQRHCDNAAQLAAHVRAAAEEYAVLRDTLWQLVDRKAATAVAIDDRRVGERSAWLAAAHTVTAGVGERSAAEELVRLHITPYVDNDIRDDWLGAMRSTTASVKASYDEAIHALASAREVCFEIPGELGPRRPPVFDEPLAPTPATATVPRMPPPAAVVPTVPAAVAAPAPPAQPPPAQPPPAPADLGAPLGDAAGLSTGAGNLGSLGGLAGSLGGLVGEVVDGIGGLLGSLADGLSDPSGSEDPLLDDPLDADDPLGDETGDETADARPTDADATGDDVGAEAPTENPPAASDSVDEPIAQQVTPPDAPPQPSPSEGQPEPPQPDGSTPCEIAADELPQAGQ